MKVDYLFFVPPRLVAKLELIYYKWPIEHLLGPLALQSCASMTPQYQFAADGGR